MVVQAKWSFTDPHPIISNTAVYYRAFGSSLYLMMARSFCDSDKTQPSHENPLETLLSNQSLALLTKQEAASSAAFTSGTPRSFAA